MKTCDIDKNQESLNVDTFTEATGIFVFTLKSKYICCLCLMSFDY